MTMSDHIFWKNKEFAEETRSANMAIAAFVKVRTAKIQIKYIIQLDAELDIYVHLFCVWCVLLMHLKLDSVLVRVESLPFHNGLL